MISFILVRPVFVFAQGVPLTLGPLTVTVPAGWIAQTNNTPVRIFSPDSTPQQFFSVQFFPPEQTSQDLREHHSLILARLAALIPPAAPPQDGVLGQFIWTRIEMRRPFGQRETLILYSAKTASLYVAAAVEATRADLVSRNLPRIEAMLARAILGDRPLAPASSATPSGVGNSVLAQAKVAPSATLGEYVYATPVGWTTNQYPDGIVLTSPVSNTGERCLISMWPMRPASASLQGDANNIFQDVFKTYEPRNRTSGGTPVTQSVVRGTAGQGWDYRIVKKGIGKPSDLSGSYETLLGFVFVAKLNHRLAVISGLSKEPLVSTCFGEILSNAWPKFFYSLRFGNWTSIDQVSAMRTKLAGVWTSATGTSADQFSFAANGRYSTAAAAQSYNRISSTEVSETTQAFFGNGAFTLTGNTIALTPDDRRNHAEPALFRVEEESKDDGKSWVETLYLLRTGAVDGKEYEVRYLKK